MVDLVFGDVKPRPMRVEAWRNSERRLEPRIVACSQRGERHLAGAPELVEIIRQLVATNVVASRVGCEPSNGSLSCDGFDPLVSSDQVAFTGRMNVTRFSISDPIYRSCKCSWR